MKRRSSTIGPRYGPYRYRPQNRPRPRGKSLHCYGNHHPRAAVCATCEVRDDCRRVKATGNRDRNAADTKTTDTKDRTCEAKTEGGAAEVEAEG